ncbi:MAG: alcohol dehydrogenase catalytic domain-containing protein [Myxococcota bacterium]
MHALTLEDTVALRDVEPPTPGPGQALIALRSAGICGTDLELVAGYKGYRGILGHEFVGEVVRCPDAPFWEGRRVTGEINLTCGECEPCRADLAKHCTTRTVMGILGHPGCFAEQLVLPFANLHEVPARVSDDEAVFTEPLAAAFELFESVELDDETEVAVFGDGRLGLLIGLALRSRDVPVVAVGRHPRKLAIVAAAGARTVQPAELGDQRFEVVVDATGSAEGLAMAFDHVQPRGTIALKSTVHGTVNLDTSALVVNEIRLVGSRCGSFDVALEALAQGRIDPRPLIDARYPLDQAAAAMEHAQRKGVLKVLLQRSP